MSSIGNEFDSWRMNKYVGTCGAYIRERLDLMAGLWDDNGTLKALAINAAGTLGFKYLTGGTNGTDKMVGLVWGATADATDTWVKDWVVPSTYRPGSKILLAACVRKLDTTGSATDNEDLALNALASWLNPAFSETENTESDGDTEINILGTLATPVPVAFKLPDGTAVLPAKAAAASVEKFRTMYADITAGMTAAQLAALKPGAKMTFKVYPNEAVGTDLNIELVELAVLTLAHDMPRNRFEKNRAKG